jgi:hypothetical protein
MVTHGFGGLGVCYLATTSLAVRSIFRHDWVGGKGHGAARFDVLPHNSFSFPGAPGSLGYQIDDGVRPRNVDRVTCRNLSDG